MTNCGTKKRAIRPLDRGRQSGGFSLVELLIVVAIMLVVAAMAMPRVVTAMEEVRMRSSMRDVVGLMQQARQFAVRDNDYYQLLVTPDNRTVYVDMVARNAAGVIVTPRNATFDASEPAVQLPQSLVWSNGGGAPVFNANVGANFNAPLNVMPAFNNRGIPCAPLGATCPTRQGGPAGLGQSGATVTYLVYFNQTRTFGPARWGAISVTSGGRMKTWVCEPNGTWHE